jgi:hypothetical protein
LGIDDRAPELRVRPTALSLEMGRIQPEAESMTLHDPDCSSGVVTQSECTHHIAPVGGDRYGVL